MKNGKLDEYAVKARVFPAFLTLLPVGLCLSQFVGIRSAALAGVSAFGGTALLSFVLAQWSRDSGRLKEQALFRLWGGKPTTAYLRHRNKIVSAPLRSRRHRRLERLIPDVTMPSVATEAENPDEADQRYEVATKALIQKTRDKEKYNLLFQELIDYGFRRNLWGLKRTAITILMCSIATILVLVHFGYRIDYDLVVGIVLVADLLIWTFLINPVWVRRAADSYAERLFDSLDAMPELEDPIPTVKIR